MLSSPQIYYVHVHLALQLIQVKPLTVVTSMYKSIASGKCTVAAAGNLLVQSLYSIGNNYMVNFCEAKSHYFTGQLKCFFLISFLAFEGLYDAT